MPWERTVGRVRFTGFLTTPLPWWHWYTHSATHHHVYLPPGLWIRWPSRELIKQEREWQRHKAAQERRKICPHSGESFRVCKASDLCDCFDYPEHEHYRGMDR